MNWQIWCWLKSDTLLSWILDTGKNENMKKAVVLAIWIILCYFFIQWPENCLFNIWVENFDGVW